MTSAALVTLITLEILAILLTFVTGYCGRGYHKCSQKPEAGMDPEPDDDGVGNEAPDDDPEAAPEDGDHREPGPDVEVRVVRQVVQPGVVGERKAS